MMTQTILSDGGMVQWHRPDCRGLCAFAIPRIQEPRIQEMLDTAPLPDTKFLIANLELEFELTYRKESRLKIPNRKYFAIFSLAPLPFSLSIVMRRNISNSNIRQFKNSTKPCNINTYGISNSNKIELFGIRRDACFSPRKATSRDMIPALAPLQ
jgi:hypothetical protein